MGIFNNIVFAFTAIGISSNSTTTTKRIKLIGSSCQNFVNVRLMTGIKENHISR